MKIITLGVISFQFHTKHLSIGVAFQVDSREIEKYINMMGVKPPGGVIKSKKLSVFLGAFIFVLGYLNRTGRTLPRRPLTNPWLLPLLRKKNLFCLSFRVDEPPTPVNAIIVPGPIHLCNWNP